MNSRGNPATTPTPGISLVVPLQDEESTIEGLLLSIAAQTLPPAEIVLVDAGCRDETFGRAVAVSADLPIRVVAAGRVFPGQARNAGVDGARHDWIAFTDDDRLVGARWLFA